VIPAHQAGRDAWRDLHAASLLDVTRLQAGARSVFPRPADLEEIIGCALAGLGAQAWAVRVDLPPGLPEVMADPPVLERVIANVTANALRYSPHGSPPLLTASARGGRVELRVADRGPGVDEADRDRIFVPFARLGDTGPATGVGLGLAVSRGLTEAMRGTLDAGDTPGGGLTMTISLPAASRPPQARPSTREVDRIGSAACAGLEHRSPAGTARGCDGALPAGEQR
jgi:two-component system sensor histidine kinase KdpD